MSRTTRLHCRLLVSFLLLVAAAGCSRSLSEVERPIPASDAPLSEIWAYAAELRVTDYARQRFGSYPEGLRRAVTQHRIQFFSTQAVPGRLPDLQSYLFFEYRRQKALSGVNSTRTPDKKSERYVRAVLRQIRSLSRRSPR